MNFKKSLVSLSFASVFFLLAALQGGFSLLFNYFLENGLQPPTFISWMSVFSAVASVALVAAGVWTLIQPNQGVLWILRDIYRVRRDLKKIAKAGGQVFVMNHNNAASVMGVCTKRAFNASWMQWILETEAITCKPDKSKREVERLTSPPRFYVYPTFTFTKYESLKAPAYTGVDGNSDDDEKMEFGEVIFQTLTRILGHQPPVYSPEGFRRIQLALIGEKQETRLLIPFLKRDGELSLEEQYQKFAGLTPAGLLEELSRP